MASTRLRQTFRYSTSDDASSPATPLDEAQQENVINALTRENASQNVLYTRALLALLLLSALLSLLTLFSHPLTSLLSVSCLGAHAYTLLLPLDRRSAAGRYSIRRSKGKRPVRSRWDEWVAFLGRGLDSDLGREELLGKWVPIGGMSLGALLAIDGLVLWRRGGEDAGRGLGLFVPGLMGVVVAMGRRWMRSVDVKELEGLRYELKGA